jgi:hypothetical protein
METSDLKNDPTYQAGFRKGFRRGAIIAALGVIFGTAVYDFGADVVRDWRRIEAPASTDLPPRNPPSPQH